GAGSAGATSSSRTGPATGPTTAESAVTSGEPRQAAHAPHQARPGAGEAAHPEGEASAPPGLGEREAIPPCAQAAPAGRRRPLRHCRRVRDRRLRHLAGRRGLVHRAGGRSRGPRLCREARSEEHTSELQSRENLVCRLLLEKKKETDDYG